MRLLKACSSHVSLLCGAQGRWASLHREPKISTLIGSPTPLHSWSVALACTDCAVRSHLISHKRTVLSLYIIKSAPADGYLPCYLVTLLSCYFVVTFVTFVTLLCLILFNSQSNLQ